MKQITQTRFKKGQVEFENISSPETDATNTRIVSLSVNQYGEFQFTTDGEHYTAIEPKILPITSIETIYQDKSDLPASQTEGTILPAYSNGSLPIKLYQTQNQQWVEVNEVQEYLFYLPLDTKILYTFLNGVFTSVGITKTSELTNDAQFLTQSDISSLVAQVGTNTSDIQTNANAITSINQKIPNEASASNQLADKAFVNSSIQTQTAHFRGNWNNWASVPTNAEDYPADDNGNKTPTSNDYMVVQDASGYTGQSLTGTWRFKYSGVWVTDGKNGWLPEYQVNETPLTAQQIAALNSGANTTNIGQISTNTNDISALQSGKQDKITSTNKLSVDLVENAAKTNASNTFSAEQTFSANIKNSGTYYIGSSNAVLASISGSALTLGDSNATLNLVGSGTYPNYNGEPLAKKYETLDITGNTQFIRGLKVFFTDRPQVTENGTNEQVALMSDIPTIPPIPTVNDATITITQGGVTKGSFTLNQSSNDTIALDAGGGLVTDVQVDSTSVVSSGVADVKTINGNYNASTNKIATASDLPQVNNASLYLQLNGNAVKTFTANASSDVTANIQALPNYSINIGSTNGGNPRQVKFLSVNYTNYDGNNACFVKLGAMCSHGNGASYTFMDDIFIGVSSTGSVLCNIYKYFQQETTLDGVTRYFGDVFYTIDTTNKVVDFYILLGQYTTANFTPYTKIGATTTNGITQLSGTPTYYSSGTKTWANGNGTTYARLSDIPEVVQSTGTDTSKVMSQKAITDELTAIITTLSNKFTNHSQSAYNCNTCYDEGVYLIANGSNCPSGSQYGSLFVMPYRKPTGNTKPDFCTQIYLPNGDDTTAPNSMFYRTSLADAWNSWQKVATTSDIPDTSNFVDTTSNQNIKGSKSFDAPLTVVTTNRVVLGENDANITKDGSNIISPILFKDGSTTIGGIYADNLDYAPVLVGYKNGTYVRPKIRQSSSTTKDILIDGDKISRLNNDSGFITTPLYNLVSDSGQASTSGYVRKRISNINGQYLTFHKQYSSTSPQTFSGGPFTNVLLAWVEQASTADTQSQRTTLKSVDNSGWSISGNYKHWICVIGFTD